MNPRTVSIVPGIVILLLACVDTPGIILDQGLQTPPEPRPDVAGQYLLNLVDGEPPPFILDTLAGCAGENGVGAGTQSISGGRIMFEEDSTYEFSHTERSVCWPNITASNDSGVGTYSVRSDRAIILTSSSTNVPGSVFFTVERDVELVWDDRTQLYTRRPLATSKNPHQQER